LPPGETGEVVGSLFVEDYALIRFGTGDLSALNPEPCLCGRATPRLLGWLGRVGAATKVRGMFLHPRQVSDLMSRFPEVAAYQIVITREEHRDDLTLRVVLKEGIDAEDLADRLKAAAREGLKFRLEVESIPSLLPNVDLIKDERTWE
ncbi:MAG TPA: hypothetical protein VI451_10060, partial [Anaerolineales bacterium]|nr:hypothetical protein [Anaerolineales bacterium]